MLVTTHIDNVLSKCSYYLFHIALAFTIPMPLQMLLICVYSIVIAFTTPLVRKKQLRS